MTVQIGHTSAISNVLAGARDLLDVVFAGDFDETDWEHSLGGMHAIAWNDGELIGHASVVQRRLIHRGVRLRVGYVEGVGVHPRWQGRGIGGRLMDQLEQMIFAAYDIGALGTSDDAIDFYEHRGWVKWLGPTSALTPSGIVRTPEEDGAVYVLPASHSLDLHGELICDWRHGDVW